MIHKLPRESYSRFRDLFRNLIEFQPMCRAVLAGVYPGMIYVDDLAEPKSAFLLSSLHNENSGLWAFLAGDSGNTTFVEALNRSVFSHEIVPEHVQALFITSDPPGWDGGLSGLTAPLPPIPFPRQHYTCTGNRYDWQADIPEGMSIVPLEVDMLNRPGLDLPAEVVDILGKWKRNDHSDTTDLGFAAVHDNKVVSWSTIDFIAEGVGDAGIFTLPDFRRRGLAAITCAAALEKGFSDGLHTAHWTCDESNLGSIRTAKKLGFVRAEDYLMHYIIFNRAQHYGTLAYMQLLQNDYNDSAKLFELAFEESPEHPGWIYYNAARAAAAVNSPEQAISYLTEAASRGWQDRAAVENCAEFTALNDHSGWDQVINQIN